MKDKPGTKVKDKSDTKVKDKPDTKVKDKEDIESSASKNEPQKTLSNGELAKTLDHIKKIFECFVCEKFINNKFRLGVRIKMELHYVQLVNPKHMGFLYVEMRFR